MHYVVVRRGWEYNDEYYYRSYDSDGEGRPVKIFDDKGKAEAYCQKNNLENLRDMELYDYWQDACSMLKVSYEQFLRSWNKIFGTKFDESEAVFWDAQWEFKIPGNATDHQIKAVHALLDVEFNDYIIVEVEGD